MKSNKKSPLKYKPARLSGQSLDEKINEIIDENALPYIGAISICVVLSIIEWIRYYIKFPPQPVVMTIVSGLIILFCLFRLIKLRKELANYKLGRDGERFVGERLEYLREKGYRIYHDIIGENFNIDHVILSQKGIFLIETKTFSKPTKGNAKIFFDGERIYSDSLKIRKDILTQVLSSSKWLQNTLKESTGKLFNIKPVIVFPGWYIEMKGNAKSSGIWVLNEKALPKFIENENEVIYKDDLCLASYHLSRYIRSI